MNIKLLNQIKALFKFNGIEYEISKTEISVKNGGEYGLTFSIREVDLTIQMNADDTAYLFVSNVVQVKFDSIKQTESVASGSRLDFCFDNIKLTELVVSYQSNTARGK